MTRVHIVGVVVGMLGGLHPTSAAGQLFPNRSIAIGSSPVAIVARDFDGDGHTDVAVVNPLSDDVSVRYARADGRFASEIRLDVGDNPRALAAADFNHDHLVDLAVSGGDSVSILLARGRGFVSSASTAVDGRLASMLVADVNGDGHPDLAVGGSGLSVLLGRGDGTFEAEPPTIVPGIVQDLASGDFNGDGRVDLALAVDTFTELTLVEIAAGDGAGRFTHLSTLTSGIRMSQIAAGDFTGDGRLDVVAGGPGAASVAVFVGLGDGAFETAIVTTTQAGQVNDIEAGDFDRDGRADAAVAGSEVMAVLFGAGDGTFRSETLVSAGAQPRAITSADLNGDALIDLVVVSPASSDAHLLVGTTLGRFDRGTRIPSASGPVGVALADLNRDGRADLTVIHRDSGDVTVQLGTGAGAFGAPARYFVGGRPRAAIVADVNEDETPDLLVAVPDRYGVFVLHGTGHGTFSAAPPIFSILNDPSALAAGDINGDGHPDVVSTSEGSGDVVLSLGLGGGRFADNVTFDLDPGAQALAVGDLNHDGLADVVVAGSSGLTLLLGIAGPPFLVAIGSFGLSSRDVLLSDVDADGALDIVSTNRGYRGADFVSEVRVYFGKGDGTFLLAIVCTAPLALPDAVAVADLSGDGRLDLVAFGHTSSDFFASDADRHGNGVAVFLANGNRTFNAADQYRAGIGVPASFPDVSDFARGGADVADVTGDGRPDLVIVNYHDDDVSLLVNAGVEGARFTTRLLTLGSGRGQVISVPAAIACEPGCTADFDVNTEIHLVPMPAAGSVFAGFTGEAGCAFTLTANVDRTCVAVFNLIAPPAPRTRLAIYQRGLWVLDGGPPGVLQDCSTDTCAIFGNGEFDASGRPRWRPVVGDWTRSGRSAIGLFDAGTQTWLLDLDGDMVLDGCDVDACYQFAGPLPAAFNTPIVGDWTGDGRDKIGVIASFPSSMTLDLNGNGRFDDCTVDACISPSLDATFAGDWAGTGVDRIGGYSSAGSWWFDLNGNFSHDTCTIDLCVDFGLEGATPVIGDWDDSGRDKIGLYRDGLWLLDWNGNFQFDGCEVDRCVFAGDRNSIPAVGKF